MFRKKYQEEDCHINQTEPYSPWKLQSEANIRELKKAACRKMVRSGAPKLIWDDAIEFEAYVRSYTDLDFYMLQGRVLDTLMLGGTYNISQFYEHGLYDGVIFRDEPIQYPDENPVLSRYLGPAIDVGP